MKTEDVSTPFKRKVTITTELLDTKTPAKERNSLELSDTAKRIKGRPLSAIKGDLNLSQHDNSHSEVSSQYSRVESALSEYKIYGIRKAKTTNAPDGDSLGVGLQDKPLSKAQKKFNAIEATLVRYGTMEDENSRIKVQNAVKDLLKETRRANTRCRDKTAFFKGELVDIRQEIEQVKLQFHTNI